MGSMLRAPTLIGTVSVDLLYSQPTIDGPSDTVLRWGGVINNMACALGVLGHDPVFMSVNYSGEFRRAVAGNLKANGVNWLPFQTASGIPFFRAKVDEQGNIADESFAGEKAIALLTPAMLAAHAEAIANSSAIVTCTDLPGPTIRWLREITRESGTSFWLLSSAWEEVRKFYVASHGADCASLNIKEFAELSNGGKIDRSNILRTASGIVAGTGQCLITLGRNGSLLVDIAREEIHYQPSPAIMLGWSSLAAGDVLFGCLLAARLAGETWRGAIYEATARTAHFLSRRTVSSELPYLYLTQGAIEPLPGRTCGDDEILRILALARG